MFIPIWGNDPIWRAYFSDGLVQPPTSPHDVPPENLHFVSKLKQPFGPLGPFGNISIEEMKPVDASEIPKTTCCTWKPHKLEYPVGVYPPGNWHIYWKANFKDDFPFPKVGYVNSLEGNSLPLKIYHPNRKGSSSSPIIFAGAKA